MQVTVASAGADPNRQNLLAPHRQARGSSLELRLFPVIAPPLPGDEHAALQEQGRGELGERRESSNRAGRDRIVGLAAGSGRDFLGAGVDGAGVGEASGARGALDEIGLTTDRLDQINAGRGQRRCQDKARKARTGADVGDPLRLGQLGDQQSGEAVLDVGPPSPIQLGDRAKGGSIYGQQLENLPERCSSRGCQPREITH